MSTYTPTCPDCKHCHRQTKAGFATNGNQRYQCQDCGRYYVRENRRFRYPADLRAKAVEMHSGGLAYRRIADLLAVNHQTITNWIASAAIEKRNTDRSPAVRLRAV
jgi:transposase-like protein